MGVSGYTSCYTSDYTSGYTYLFRMVVLLRFGHSAHVELYSFVSGFKRAIPVLRNWRYVTYLYQDSPFFEIGGLHRCFPSYCAIGARLFRGFILDGGILPFCIGSTCSQGCCHAGVDGWNL